MGVQVFNPQGGLELSLPPVPAPLEGTVSPCPECGGSGQVTTIDYVPYGDGDTPLEQVWECDLCEGKGEVSEAVKFGYEAGWLG